MNVGKNSSFELSDVEVETLRRAAKDRGMAFDPNRRSYSDEELRSYGLVREGYTREEMSNVGVVPVVVTCFDDISVKAETAMEVDAPFGEGIKKWQLPVDMMPIRVSKTVFKKGSVVKEHMHPIDTAGDPGGGLRMIAKGSIEFQGKRFGPGDWFFVPNGIPYSFTTDKNVDTEVFYTYRFFGAVEGNRFSHPHEKVMSVI